MQNNAASLIQSDDLKSGSHQNTQNEQIIPQNNSNEHASNQFNSKVFSMRGDTFKEAQSQNAPSVQIPIGQDISRNGQNSRQDQAAGSPKPSQLLENDQSQYSSVKIGSNNIPLQPETQEMLRNQMTMAIGKNSQQVLSKYSSKGQGIVDVKGNMIQGQKTMLYGNKQFELKSNVSNSMEIASQKISQDDAFKAERSSLNKYKLKKTKTTGIKEAFDGLADITGSIYSDAIDSDEDQGPGRDRGISIADNATVFNMDHPRDNQSRNMNQRDKKEYSTNQENNENITILMNNIQGNDVSQDSFNVDRETNKFNQSSQILDQTDLEITNRDLTKRALIKQENEQSKSLAKKRREQKKLANSQHPTFGGGRVQNNQSSPEDPGLKIKVDFVNKVKQNMTLSARKLQRHIYEWHPIQMDAKKDHYEQWSIFQQGLPALINFPCCMRRKITKVQRSLGLGASLYLMTLKAYIKLFLLASLLCSPTIIFINQQNWDKAMEGIGNQQTKEDNQELQQNIDLNITQRFEKRYELVCAETSTSENAQNFLKLTCPDSSLIQSIVSIGLSKESFGDQSTCSKVEKVERLNIFVDRCHYLLQEDETFESIQLKEKIKSETTCLDQKECNIAEDFVQWSQQCLDQMNSGDFTKFQVQARCVDTFLIITQDNENYRPQAEDDDESELQEQISESASKFMKWVNKFSQLQVIAFTDTVILLILIVGFNLIQFMQKDFSEVFKKSQVDIRDFTLVIDKLPDTYQQYKDPLSLKFAIWNQIQSQIALCKEEKKCDQDLDPSIVEINLMMSDNHMVRKQYKLKKLVQALESLYAKLLSAQSIPRRILMHQETAKARIHITNNTELLQTELDAFKVDYAEQFGLEKPDFDDFEANEVGRQAAKRKAKEFFESILQIQVTFVSMKTRNLVQRLFWTKERSKCLRMRKDEKVEPIILSNQDKKEFKLKDIALKIGGSLFIKQPNEREVFYIQDLNDAPDDLIKMAVTDVEPQHIDWDNVKMLEIKRAKKYLWSYISIVIFLTCLGLLAFLQPDPSQTVQDNTNFKEQCSANMSLEDGYLAALDLKKKIDPENARKDVNCFCEQEFNNKKASFLDEGVDLNAYLKQNKTELSGSDLDDYFDLLEERQNREVKESSNYLDSDSTLQHPIENGIPFDAIWEEQSKGFKKRINPTSGNLEYERSGKPWNSEFFTYQDLEFVADYCQEWFETEYKLDYEEMMQRLMEENKFVFMKYVLIVILEVALGLPLVIFLTSTLERHHLKSTRTYCVFFKSTMVMVVSILFFIGVNLVLKEKLMLVDTRMLFQNGKNLSLCILLNFLLYLFVHFCSVSKVLVKRCSDRGCKLSLYKSDDEDHDDIYSDYAGFEQSDEINSIGQKYQRDLNSTYTGQQFDGGMMQAFIISTIFITLSFCGGMPQLYFTCTAYLIILYFYSKASLLRFSQKVVDFNDKFIGQSYQVLVLAFITHFVFAFIAFEKPDGYLSFIIIIGIFYLVNLLLFNPVTCCMKLQCCQRKKSTKRSNTGVKNADASNTYSGNRNNKNSDAGANTERQENQSFTKSNQPEELVKSQNLYSEISFEQLEYQYKSAFKAIIEAHQRFQLYFRIANINQGSQLGQVFKLKHEQIEIYIESLFLSKKKIEDQIEFYIQYLFENLNIKGNFEVSEESQKQFESEQLEVDSIEIEEIDSPKNQIKGALSQKSFDQKSNHLHVKKVNSALKSKLTFSFGKQEKDLLVNDDRSINLENKDTGDLNKIINKLQKTNSLAIQNEEAFYERALTNQCQVFFMKLRFLSENIEEEWLRQNHLPMNFRCCNLTQSYNILASKDYIDLDGVVQLADQLVQDPFLDEVLKSQKQK